MKISIIVPVFNEKDTIGTIIKKLKLLDFHPMRIEKEIIIVDDGSTDGTREILKKSRGVKVILHQKNSGKGAAVRTGMESSSGDILVIQDADLEYDPEEIPKLVRPIYDKEEDVVYGSRFIGKIYGKRIISHAIGNKMLSLLTSVMFFRKINDMETCYKVFTANALKRVGRINSRSFDFEPEITAKFIKRGFRIREIPINYYARDFEEGKKITWRDGIRAALVLIKYRFND